jgi:hypothetical protein
MSTTGRSSYGHVAAVNFQVVLKKAPEVLKNAAGQIGIIFFVEQLINTLSTHRDPDAFAPLLSFFEKN